MLTGYTAAASHQHCAAHTARFFSGSLTNVCHAHSPGVSFRAFPDVNVMPRLLEGLFRAVSTAYIGPNAQKYQLRSIELTGMEYSSRGMTRAAVHLALHCLGTPCSSDVHQIHMTVASHSWPTKRYQWSHARLSQIAKALDGSKWIEILDLGGNNVTAEGIQVPPCPAYVAVGV